MNHQKVARIIANSVMILVMIASIAVVLFAFVQSANAGTVEVVYLPAVHKLDPGYHNACDLFPFDPACVPGP